MSKKASDGLSASRVQIFAQLRTAGFDWPVLEIQRLEGEVDRLELLDDERKEVIQRLQAEVERLREVNESVAVCPKHVSEVVKGNCLVCECEDANERTEAAEACLSEIRALPDEWEKEGPCEEWAGLNDAAQQLRKILEKYDGNV